MYRITPYDPAAPEEEAFLRAAAAFAEECGVDRLTIRRPSARLLGPDRDGMRLDALFPGLRGYHDGAQAPLGTALELVRMMLRGDEGRCLLESGDAFFVHIGPDRDVYIGADRPCGRAVAFARQLGLFPEPVPESPHSAEPGEPGGPQRPADEEFWARLRWLVSTGRAGLLEEEYVRNLSRRHRLTPETVDAVRAGLAPRALLTLWPPLPADRDEDASDSTAGSAAGARAAALPVGTDEYRPLLSGVLVDEDGVLRAGWRTPWTPCDETWAFLAALRPGQTVSGTVTGFADTVAFVDVDGFPARIRQPELSWPPFPDPAELVGREVTAQVLQVDLVREELYLSLRALQQNPLEQLTGRVGRVVPGVVTKVLPFGLFVRIEDGPGGLQGLVPAAELAGEEHRVGDPLAVQLLEVDLTRQRFLLSRRRALAAGAR
ncbi:hypothetical protein KCH_20320 [Kitasatospora cheerisanensis KCTC 2395]|uniref:S1 motif domain-containing protein n=1 Tax=Kitasatospora cheerisanensis KCTC 2395 TaxID=1348663 RepID=A0A066Z7U5_9ACTN|nr:hypothetical protein KCH_20320 [Kitasatospora cheerisanensis KCTC 2395]